MSQHDERDGRGSVPTSGAKVHLPSFGEGAVESRTPPAIPPSGRGELLEAPDSLSCWICCFQSLPPGSSVIQMVGFDLVSMGICVRVCSLALWETT